MSSTNALEVLIQALRRLPGVGVKSAQRMAFHLMQHDRVGAEALSVALHDAVQNVHHCARCHTFTEDDICSTCLDPERDASRLCAKPRRLRRRRWANSPQGCQASPAP